MFFFASRRRHTRFKCDWSSDVCSSHLLAGKFMIERLDVDGEAGEALDHELAGEASVPGGSAGGDGDLGGGTELVGGDVEVVEEDFAGLEGDAAEGGVADGAGLLVDLLEHEVLVARLFGLDGVPVYGLDPQRRGLPLPVRDAAAQPTQDLYSPVTTDV